MLLIISSRACKFLITIIIYHIFTESEVITGISQTKALVYFIARSIHQSQGLLFPCNDQTNKVNKLFSIWPFHYGLESAIN